MKKYLGIDVGGTYIKYGIYNQDGEQLNSDKIKTNMKSLEEFIEPLINIINQYEDVDGIGISFPGFIDVNSGLIIDPGAILPLKGKNLKEIILDRCRREIDIENDANCVALAEKWKGNGQEYSNCITITIGTGIGGGIILNDKLYRGNRFMAGEFGYMIVNGLNNENPKKSTSSLIASTQALINSVSEIKNIESKDLSGEAVFKMLEDKDEDVMRIYDKWIENLSLTIYNLAFCFAPEAILIGGGVSAQPRVIQDIKNKVEEFDERINDLVVIDKCKFDNDSGKIGAVYNHLVNNNKK